VKQNLGRNLNNLILYILFVYGIASLISSELIFAPLVDKFKQYEKVYYHLTCPKCLSISIGFLVSLGGLSVVNPFVDPILAYSFTLIMNTILSYFEDNNHIDLLNE
jgi:hypothetical protein